MGCTGSQYETNIYKDMLGTINLIRLYFESLVS